jgi:hypothetical protein
VDILVADGDCMLISDADSGRVGVDIQLFKVTDLGEQLRGGGRLPRLALQMAGSRERADGASCVARTRILAYHRWYYRLPGDTR